jgi:thioredoxin-like negative regulator of GroEL
MDVDHAPGLLEELQVDSLPRLILFKNGNWLSTPERNSDAGGKNVLEWLAEQLTDKVPAAPGPLAGSPLPTACAPSS